MTKVLVYALGVSPVDCPSQTGNLSASGTWSAQFVSCAEQRHWSLFTDGTVDVHRPATRSEVIVTLMQAFNISPVAASGSIFTDVQPSMTFGGYIARAKQDGIVSGYTDENGDPTGLFGPDDNVTRAAFAKIVTGAMQVYKIRQSVLNRSASSASVSSTSDSSSSADSSSSESEVPSP